MKFFADEAEWADGAPYTYDWQHITLICVMTALIVVGLILLWKKSKKTTDIVLIVLWAIQVVLEFGKIGLFVYYHGFGILRYRYCPIHLCSMFMYLFPFFMWGKGKVKQAATAFCVTIGFFGGIVNFTFSDMMYYTPALSSFFGLHALVYHGIMVFCAILIGAKYYKMQKFDYISVFVVLMITSVPAVIFDYVFGANYMFLRSGGTTPLKIISKYIPYNWVWTIIMIVLYFGLCVVLHYVAKFCYWIDEKIKNKKTKEELK